MSEEFKLIKEIFSALQNGEIVNQSEIIAKIQERNLDEAKVVRLMVKNELITPEIDSENDRIVELY